MQLALDLRKSIKWKKADKSQSVDVPQSSGGTPMNAIPDEKLNELLDWLQTLNAT